jgi:phage FluMu gp28-like protein
MPRKATTPQASKANAVPRRDAISATMPAPVLAVSRESYFLPHQDAWIDDDAPFKLAEKSRRVGFTYATSYRSFKKCLTRERFTQWVSSRDMLTAKEFVTDYIARWCRLGNVVARGIAGDNVEVFGAGDIKAFIVDFPGGSRIVSLSSTPEVFAGKGGDVLLDELDLHQDPGRVYDMARPCTTWGGQLEAISAYAVDGSPASVFAQLCKDARGPNPMRASLHRVTLDDAIALGFVECVNKVTGSTHTRESFRALIRAGCRNEAAFQSQYMCNPQDDGGALLTYDLIRSCEVSASEIESAIRAALKTAPRYLGIDVGRKRDLTCMWLLAKIGDILWTAQVKTMEKALFRYQYATAVDIIEANNVRRCCVDAAGIGAQLGEDLNIKFGSRVEAIQSNHATQMEIGMPMLSAFEDRLIRIPADQTIRESLHKIRKVTTASNAVRLEAEHDEAGHADEFWALALSRHAADAKVSNMPPTTFKRGRRAAIMAQRRAARNWKELAA